MKSFGLLTLALLLVPPGAFAEQIGETRLLGPNVGSMPPLQVVVAATVVDVRRDSGKVRLRDRQGNLYQFTWRDDILLRAKWRRSFDGRKRLAFEDLTEGQKVRIRLRHHPRYPRRIDKITVVRVVEANEARPSPEGFAGP